MKLWAGGFMRAKGLVLLIPVLTFCSLGGSGFLGPFERKGEGFVGFRVLVKKKDLKDKVIKAIPAWDINSDGFRDFVFLTWSGGFPEIEKSILFVSGRTGEILHVKEYESILKKFEPVSLEPLCSPKKPWVRSFLVLGKKSPRNSRNGLVWILFGKGVLKVRDLTVLDSFGTMGKDFTYQCSFGKGKNLDFPPGVIITRVVKNEGWGKLGIKVVLIGIKRERALHSFWLGPIPENTPACCVWNSILYLGEVNKEGVPAIGVFSYKDDQNGGFSFRLYLGFSGKKVFEEPLFLPSPEDGYFPITVCPLPDINNDSWADFVVGNCLGPEKGKKRNAGMIRAFSGKDGLEIYSRYGEKELDEFGSRVESISDLDGDGCPELVVSAPQYAFGWSEDGKGYVEILSGKTGKPLGVFRGEEKGEYFGSLLVANRDSILVFSGPPDRPPKSFWVLKVFQG